MTEAVRRKVAHALGLMEHNWRWDDPENGDIFCRFCEIRDSSQTKRGPCSKKPAPTEARLLRMIESQRKQSWKKLIKLAELEELLT